MSEEKAQIARLVLDFSSNHRNSVSSDTFTWNIDLGNFATNETDVVYIEMDYMTPLFLASQSATVINDNRSIELLLDVPQFNSFDTSTGNQTNHLCFMDRDYGTLATNSSTSTAPRDPLDSTIWQVWKHAHKPQRIPVRPEVLQQKRWTIKLQFVDSSEPNSTLQLLSTSAMYEFSVYPKLVLSITK